MLTPKIPAHLMDYLWPLLALLYTIIFAFLTNKLKKQNITKKVPPGPKPWPIIGNLNLIGPIPHQSIHSLSLKYGEIMQLKFGKFPVVVASSPEMAKQFLRVHDRVFASRPALAAGKYTTYNYSDMVWAPYGPHWRQARKIYLTEVFNAQTLGSYEQIRIEERQNFLYRLYTLSGKPFVLREHLSRYMLATISRMVSSNKYFSETEHGNSMFRVDELQGMLDEWFLLNGVLNIGDWVPWLDFLDLQGYVKRMKDLNKKFDRFHEYVIDDHQERRKGKEGFVAKDVLDKLLQVAEDPNLEIKLSRDSIKGLLQDLLTGGTDTSATTIEWAIHELVRHPHIIEKAKEELDRAIARSRWVEEDDFSKLPYVEAIIKESLRLHPLATFLAPHYATEDCNVSGYDISKGTMIMVNTWSIGRDPRAWDSPEEFLPERFLGKEVDMLGSNFALLPFGSGRRRCPGYKLGLKLVRTTLANLIHGFDWRLPEGMKVDDVCMEEVYGLTTCPKVSLKIIMEPSLSIPYGVK